MEGGEPDRAKPQCPGPVVTLYANLTGTDTETAARALKTAADQKPVGATPNAMAQLRRLAEEAQQDQRCSGGTRGRR